MSRGLGTRQRQFLTALRELEAKHGVGKWFYTHAVVRQACPAPRGRAKRGVRLLRPSREAEAALNPSRVLAALAKRDLIIRNVRHGQGASVCLSDAGRTLLIR